MQYDTIILELLARIKTLENEVNELKQIISSFHINANYSNNKKHDTHDLQFSNTTEYKKMTDEMIDICYKCGKKLRDGEGLQDLADSIVEETGMNRNSAIMYLYAVQGMLDGTVYKRTISAKATKIFFNKIFNEYGSVGLKKAISASRQHAAYRQECGLPYESIAEICDIYENKL